MGRLHKGATAIATYTQEGRILIDGTEVATFDADGGTWDHKVRSILMTLDWRVDGPWIEDTDGNSHAAVYEPTAEVRQVPIAPEGLVTGQNGGLANVLRARRRGYLDGARVWAEGDWREVVAVHSHTRRTITVSYLGTGSVPTSVTDGSSEQRVISERVAVPADLLPGYYAASLRSQIERRQSDAERAQREQDRREIREEIKAEERQTAEQARAEKLAKMSPETRRETLLHEFRVAEAMVESRQEYLDAAQRRLAEAKAQVEKIRAELTADDRKVAEEGAKADQGEVLDFAAIKAAGIPTDGLGTLPTGEWVAYKHGDASVAVSFASGGQDEEDHWWWTATTYDEGDPKSTDSFPSLTELLDHVAKVTR